MRHRHCCRWLAHQTDNRPSIVFVILPSVAARLETWSASLAEKLSGNPFDHFSHRSRAHAPRIMAEVAERVVLRLR